MKEMTCVVVGGGYAGIHAVKQIQKAASGQSQTQLRIVLIDKNSYHLRKVLLFKPAAKQEEIKIPLTSLFPEGVQFIQAAVTKIEHQEQRLHYRDADGNNRLLSYDKLVLAAGSVVREPEPAQGGVALTDLAAAESIRQTWTGNLTKALNENNAQERRRLMTISVAGAGISGIETAAELASVVREEAQRLGLDPNEVTIRLLNAHATLFEPISSKAGSKLESLLASYGVTVMHRSKVVRERDGVLTLASGQTLPTGLCIWTLGLLPSPFLRTIGLPLTPDGYVPVDESYRVPGTRHVYSIGDCAHIIDVETGLADGKTCKEASAQAARLAKIVFADWTGNAAPTHKRYMDFFCIGLGPGRGMIWTRQWGLDIIIAGKLGWRIRKYTWDIASLLA
ncbi:MAG: dehydrogenase [Paenibacillus sp.]|jgi:NADH dehydrogenase|nr:dehydrogenase [Paenibacillus sp.]